MSAADRVYPALLRAYPRDWAAAHGDEVLATLESSSEGRVLPREVMGLLVGGFRQRRLEDRLRSRVATLDSASWLATVLLLGVILMSGVAIAVGQVKFNAETPGTFQLAMLLTLAKFALVLRGCPGAALLLAPFPYLLLLIAAEPTILPIWVDALSVAGMAGLVIQRRPTPSGSWWWLLAPVALGIAMVLPSPPLGIAIGIALSPVLLIAACEARFALAAAPSCFALATHWAIASFSLDAGFLLLAAIGLATIGLALLLQAAASLRPRPSASLG